MSQETRAQGLSAGVHRILIGTLGLSLPFLVVVAAEVFPRSDVPGLPVLDSVSSYYYTSGVGVFVGVLFALALFLYAYPGYASDRADRFLGKTACVAAIGVACFPTSPPSCAPHIAPGWWQPWMTTAHHVAAITLFIAFFLFAAWLFRRSSVKPPAVRPPEKQRRDVIYLACASLIAVGIVWAGAAMLLDRNATIFWPEAIAIVGFAVSWLVKGTSTDRSA